MLAPKSWLHQFVNLNGITDSKFVQEMTGAGNKVEAVHKIEGETVFEFEITSNRPDTLSIIGLAREAAAIFGQTLKLTRAPQLKTGSGHTPALTISDKKLCPIYSAVVINKVKVKPSSSLIRNRLTQAGVRSVNNIVDITNYLMLQTCQPMHAFDLDQIKGKLTLRRSRAGETITPLDHVARTLFGGEIIIEDETKIIDLAGLMGGLNTEVGDTTTTVLLLVPIYDSVTIRRASTKLKLRTEASNRFEKKLDLNQTEVVAQEAALLMSRESGGEISGKIITIGDKDKQQLISLTEKQLEQKIGFAIPLKTAAGLLKNIGVEAKDNGFIPPSWRRDLEQDVDLIEEVARLYGYNRFPKTLPTGNIPIHAQALKPNLIRQIKSITAGLGYFETYSSTLISQSDSNHLQVLHPMSKDFTSMRVSISESLLPVLNFNLDNKQEVNLFELGTVFKLNPKSGQLPIEEQELGLISTTVDFRELKGQLESLGHSLNLSLEINPVKTPLPGFDPDHQAQIELKGRIIGLIAQTTDRRAWVATVNATILASHAGNLLNYPAPSPFPAILEDLTITLPVRTLIGPVIKTITETDKLLFKAELTGIYQQNYTFHLTYQSATKQLTAEAVKPIRKAIVANLRKQYKAVLVGLL